MSNTKEWKLKFLLTTVKSSIKNRKEMDLVDDIEAKSQKIVQISDKLKSPPVLLLGLKKNKLLR